MTDTHLKTPISNDILNKDVIKTFLKANPKVIYYR